MSAAGPPRRHLFVRFILGGGKTVSMCESSLTSEFCIVTQVPGGVTLSYHAVFLGSNGSRRGGLGAKETAANGEPMAV